LTSALALPKETTKKVFKALRNLLANPSTPGLHPERLSGKAEHLWSARVDDDYRLIYRQAGAQPPVLIFVGKHDDSYRFAERTFVPAPSPVDSEVLPRSEPEEPFSIAPESPGESIDLTLDFTDSEPQQTNETVAQIEDVEALITGPKYLPLAYFLLHSVDDRVTLTFEEIERLIGKRLPSSASLYREWWANEPRGHVQARAWLGVGRKVQSVNRATRTVTFSSL
jgi:Txe/YoeB family toxin of Txe-Axe toxin-antitoxin module